MPGLKFWIILIFWQMNAVDNKVSTCFYSTTSFPGASRLSVLRHRRRATGTRVSRGCSV